MLIIKVWITKYCLSHGIELIEAEVCSSDSDIIKRIKSNTGDTYQCDEYFHGEGKEWHRTKKSAINKANEIKSKKITSLKNQLNKLESLHFD